MKFNPIAGTTKDFTDYKGSIVNLTQDTEYEIDLSLDETIEQASLTAKTWSENFPIASQLTAKTKKNIFILISQNPVSLSKIIVS